MWCKGSPRRDSPRTEVTFRLTVDLGLKLQRRLFRTVNRPSHVPLLSMSSLSDIPVDSRSGTGRHMHWWQYTVSLKSVIRCSQTHSASSSGPPSFLPRRLIQVSYYSVLCKISSIPLKMIGCSVPIARLIQISGTSSPYERFNSIVLAETSCRVLLCCS